MKVENAHLRKARKLMAQPHQICFSPSTPNLHYFVGTAAQVNRRVLQKYISHSAIALSNHTFYHHVSPRSEFEQAVVLCTMYTCKCQSWQGHKLDRNSVPTSTHQRTLCMEHRPIFSPVRRTTIPPLALRHQATAAPNAVKDKNHLSC